MGNFAARVGCAGNKPMTLREGKSNDSICSRSRSRRRATLIVVRGHRYFAQKPGGVLNIYDWDNPPSLSIHEEVTTSDSEDGP